jgi:hypothetical protein
VVQVSSPVVPVELRSASPVKVREVMSDAADAFQCTAPKGVDPFVHDRNLAHAHADVWLWRSPASRPGERNLDLCRADCVDLDRTGRDDRLDCEICCAPTHGSRQSGMTLLSQLTGCAICSWKYLDLVVDGRVDRESDHDLLDAHVGVHNRVGPRGIPNDDCADCDAAIVMTLGVYLTECDHDRVCHLRIAR